MHPVKQSQITVLALLPPLQTKEREGGERERERGGNKQKLDTPWFGIVTHTNFMLWRFIVCGICVRNVLYISIYDYNCWYICCRCVLSNCILCDEVEVRNNSELKDCLVGSHHTVAAEGKLCPQSLRIYNRIPSELISCKNQKSYVFHVPFYIMIEYYFYDSFTV
jgi:hypothetical protein